MRNNINIPIFSIRDLQSYCYTQFIPLFYPARRRYKCIIYSEICIDCINARPRSNSCKSAANYGHILQIWPKKCMTAQLILRIIRQLYSCHKGNCIASPQKTRFYKRYSYYAGILHKTARFIQKNRPFLIVLCIQRAFIQEKYNEEVQ